jgi:integrase
MASIYKKHGRARWTIAYVDHNGMRREKTSGTSERRVAEQVAASIEARVAQRKAGIVDPRAEALSDQGRRPITQHVAEYASVLKARGRSAQHVQETRRSIERVLEAAHVERVCDLSASGVEEAVASLRVAPRTELKADDSTAAKSAGQPEKRGTRGTTPKPSAPFRRSARTCNKLLQAVTSFTRWLVRNGRLAADPLLAVSRLNANVDRKRERCALDGDDVAKLVQAAENGPAYRGLSGPDRAMLYRLALGTGLRASELASLTPASFDLDADPTPTLTVAAAYSKHRKEDVLPLGVDLTKRLRPWLAGRFRSARVFTTAHLEDKTADMMRFDLKRAEVDPTDASGRVRDFHALRHTFVSNVVRAGATVKEAQALARHATPDLTFRVYSHVQRHDLARVLANVPAIGAPKTSTTEVARKTGTAGADSVSGCQQKRQHSPHRDTPDDAAPCREVEARVVSTRDPNSAATAVLCPTLPLDAANGMARPAGIEPATVGLEIRCSIQLSYGRS